MKVVPGSAASRAARLAVLALVVLLAAAACFSAPKQSAVKDPATPLRDALRVRADRLMAGDLEGFLQYLNGPARAAEEPIGRGAIAAEVSTLEFVVADSVPNATGGFDRVEVEWVYRYKGVPDDNVFRFRRLYQTEPQGSSVLITDSRDDPASIPPLWATGPVAIARSPHFLALSRPEQANVPDVLAIAEDARVDLLPKLHVPDDVHVVVLTPDKYAFAEYRREPPADDVLALARFTTRPSGAENREMVVNVGAALGSGGVAYEDQSSVTPTKVFRHELGHLALAKFTGATTPSWVVEGAAMFVSGERREVSWRDEVADNFKDLSLGRLRQPGRQLIAAEYPYANAAVLYLVEAFGAPTFWQFYENLKRSDIDTMLTRFYRTEDDRLDTATQDWIRKQVGAQ